MVAEAHNLTLFHDGPTGLDYAADIGETTPVSWKPRHELTFEEWAAVGRTMATISGSLKWWAGDWLNYGDGTFGDGASQLYDIFGWDYSMVSRVKWVSSRIMSTLRNVDISWSHHYEVASLEPAEQAAWLSRAKEDGWSVRRLREESKGPALPKLSVSFAEPSEVPFNHQIRSGIPQEERTAVDEYEQQADELAGDNEGYTWSQDVDQQRSGTVHYLEPQEQIYTNGSAKPHVANNSGNNEWYTPGDFIEAARLTLGKIELDPATSEEANAVVRADTIYTVDDDGLVQQWTGKVWLNPPYSSDLVGRFIDKLIFHFLARDVDEAIVLVNNATETRWFQALAVHASAICFPASRIRFWCPDGLIGSPLQGQAILYLGTGTQNFLDNFDFFGLLVKTAKGE